MLTTALSHAEQRPPSPGGEWHGIVLSALVHTGLLAVLLLGLRWQPPPPSAASAELWAAAPQALPPAPPVVSTPPLKPPPAPPVQMPTTTQPDADIALEKARKARAEEEQRQKERQARELREQREKRELAEKAEKAERAEKAEKAARLEKLKKEEAAQKLAKAEREAKAQLEAQKRDQAAAEKAMARQREENLARMMGQLGSSGSGIDARGSAASGGGSGPSASYAGRIVQAIKPNIVFGDSVAGNPAAEVEVRTGPGGTILGSTLLKSSGIPEWDSAVMRAIERTGSLPKDTDGRVPPRLTISFRPKD